MNANKKPCSSLSDRLGQGFLVCLLLAVANVTYCLLRLHPIGRITCTLPMAPFAYYSLHHEALLKPSLGPKFNKFNAIKRPYPSRRLRLERGFCVGANGSTCCKSFMLVAGDTLIFIRTVRLQDSDSDECVFCNGFMLFSNALACMFFSHFQDSSRAKKRQARAKNFAAQNAIARAEKN